MKYIVTNAGNLADLYADIFVEVKQDTLVIVTDKGVGAVAFKL